MSGLKKTYRLSQALFASSVLMMPALAFADTVYPPDANTTQQTSVTGNIDIQPLGKIHTAAGDAVQVNSASAIVLVEANNVNPDAINSNNAIGVNIQTTGTNALIINNINSEIIGKTAGIQINGAFASISNSGDILSTAGPAVDILATGTGATIFNDSTGLIEGTGGQGIWVNGGGLTLTNGGTVTTPDAVSSAIFISSNFETITNQSTGKIIAAGTGVGAIRLNTANISGEIINSGLITHNGANVGAGYGVWINQNFDGSVLNTSAGTISSQSKGMGAAINIDGAFNEINNEGTIEATNVNGGTNVGILSSGTFAGTINNDGIIRGFSGIAINLAGSLTDLNNTGTITSDDVFTTILVSGGSFTGAINNLGNISNTGGGTKLALSLNTAQDVLLNQNGGTITGNINLAGLSAHQNVALNMNGGTIIGDVFSSQTKASTINLNSGMLNGNFEFKFAGGVGTENILNIDGTVVTGNITGSAAGNDIFNLSGGSFTKLDGNGGNDIVNVPGNFTLTGTINDVDEVNVINAGTLFSVANTGVLSNVGIISIDPNTRLSVATNGTINTTTQLINAGNFTVNGANVDIDQVTNNGRVNVTSLGQLNVNMGGYLQNVGGSYAMQIATDTVYGKIDVQGAAAVDGTINPYLGPAGAFIKNGDTFDVIETTAGLVTVNGYTIVQPASALVFFTDTSDLNTLQLTANLRSIGANGISDIAQAVGTALDPLFLNGNTTNPELIALFGQLQLLPSVVELNAALEQLAPPFNYAPVAIAHIAMDNAFDSAQLRLEWLKGVNPLSQDDLYKKHQDEMFYNGVSYGDFVVTATSFGQVDTNIYHHRGTYGGWVKLYGSYYDQLKRTVDSRNLTVEAYTAESTGYAVGADWAPSDYFVFGVAGSYAKTTSTDKTEQRNSIDLESIMATFYSWFQITPNFYMDTIVGIASHEYDMMRNIAIGNLSLNAQGQPYGFQYGAQVDIGYAFSSDRSYIVAPFVRGKYTNLKIGTYTEIGAGGLNLQVENDPVNEEILGVGLRVALLRDYVEALYVPEASAMILYDFAGESQQTESIFLGGTSPFYTNSIEPEKFIQIYSVGISAYTGDNYAFAIKFNFEHRDHFFAYNGYMQLNYSWG